MCWWEWYCLPDGIVFYNNDGIKCVSCVLSTDPTTELQHQLHAVVLTSKCVFMGKQIIVRIASVQVHSSYSDIFPSSSTSSHLPPALTTNYLLQGVPPYFDTFLFSSFFYGSPCKLDSVGICIHFWPCILLRVAHSLLHPSLSSDYTLCLSHPLPSYSPCLLLTFMLRTASHGHS